MIAEFSKIAPCSLVPITGAFLLIFITKTRPCFIQIFFFSLKILDIFNILAQNIHCGYLLELPRHKNLQCMFWIKNKKIRYTSAKPSFSI